MICETQLLITLLVATIGSKKSTFRIHISESETMDKFSQLFPIVLWIESTALLQPYYACVHAHTQGGSRGFDRTPIFVVSCL